MGQESSTKFIQRNKMPRVHIGIDIEDYNSEKKTEIPFVMGVLADLSGKSNDELADLSEREFDEIDAANFDQVLKESKPRVSFTVPNTVTGEGDLVVDVTFEDLAGFSPAAVARKVGGLRELLEKRRRLDNLLTYLKPQAVKMLQQIVKDRSLLDELVSQRAEEGGAVKPSESTPDSNETTEPGEE